MRNTTGDTQSSSSTATWNMTGPCTVQNARCLAVAQRAFGLFIAALAYSAIAVSFAFRIALFLLMRRTSLLDTNQRLLRASGIIRASITLFRKRRKILSCDSPGRSSTLICFPFTILRNSLTNQTASSIVADKPGRATLWPGCVDKRVNRVKFVRG